MVYCKHCHNCASTPWGEDSVNPRNSEYLILDWSWQSGIDMTWEEWLEYFSQFYPIIFKWKKSSQRIMVQTVSKSCCDMEFLSTLDEICSPQLPSQYSSVMHCWAHPHRWQTCYYGGCMNPYLTPFTVQSLLVVMISQPVKIVAIDS